MVIRKLPFNILRLCRILPLLCLLTACRPSAQQPIRENATLSIEATDSATYSYTGPKGDGQLHLQALTDSTYELQHLIGGTIVSQWPLRYRVYRFDCGDVTGDSIPEIVVGTIKATHYHPDLDRRLFIFHLVKQRHIRPLWLGSRVSHPLLDFKVERDSIPALIHTWERSLEGDTLQHLYRQKGFGLKFAGKAI